MKFKYVGQKSDGERAFKEKTGIEWMPASEHDVADPEVCAEMLKHPTVWQPVAGEAVTLAQAAPKPYPLVGLVDDTDVDEEMDRKAKADAPASIPAETIEPPAAEPIADPLAGLDDVAVRAFAKARGLKINGIALTKGENLRAKVRQAMKAA